VVEIRWTSSKTPAASATNIGVDAFDVMGTLVGATRFEQTNSHLVWAPTIGAWTTSTVSSASGGSFRFSNTPGAKVTINFTGVKLVLVVKRSPAYGSVRIRVDGGDTYTVDLYSATALYQQKIWETGILAPGEHTVTIERTGKKRPAAAASNVNLDAVDVIGVLR
jgi:hypothetical protein